MNKYDFSKIEDCLQFLKDIQEDHATATFWATLLCMRAHITLNENTSLRAAFINSPEFAQIVKNCRHLLPGN
jgi:hypothetical protein